jgi:hypothetical protein
MLICFVSDWANAMHAAANARIKGRFIARLVSNLDQSHGRSLSALADPSLAILSSAAKLNPGGTAPGANTASAGIAICTEGSMFHAGGETSTLFRPGRGRVGSTGTGGFTGAIRKAIAGAFGTAGRWNGIGSTRGRSINMIIAAVAATPTVALHTAQRNRREFFRVAIALQ